MASTAQPPTTPSFSNFKFNTIGQQPELLKRFTAPNPQYRYHSLTPEPEDKTADTASPLSALPRPTLLESLAETDTSMTAKQSIAEQYQHSAQHVGADSRMQDVVLSSDKDATLRATASPRLERQIARSQHRLPTSYTFNPPNPRIPVPLSPQANGVPNPSSPSLPGHDSARLVTLGNNSSSAESAQVPTHETLAPPISSSDTTVSLMAGPPVLPSATPTFYSPLATPIAIASATSTKSPLQKATLQDLQTRILTSLATLIDLSPSTATATRLDSSPISLALQLAHNAAHSSISQADTSALAAQTAHNLAQLSINISQDASNAVQQSLDAAQDAQAATQRSCEAAQKSLGASNESLSGANEARLKANEAMRVVEMVGEEIKKRDEEIRMRENELRQREEKIKKVAIDAEEIIGVVGNMVQELRERERVEGEERRRLELNALKMRLDEQEKERQAVEARRKERSDEHHNAETMVTPQASEKEETLSKAREKQPETLVQGTTESAVQKQPEPLPGKLDREIGKEGEKSSEREKTLEGELRKKQEKMRAVVMMKKQVANQEAAAKILADREAKERGRPENEGLAGRGSAPTSTMIGLPVSPQRAAATTSNPTSNGDNIASGNVVANRRQSTPIAPKVGKVSGGVMLGPTPVAQRGNVEIASTRTSLMPAAHSLVNAVGTISIPSQSKVLPSVTEMPPTNQVSSEVSTKRVNDLSFGTTHTGSTVSAGRPFGSVLLGSDKTSHNFTTDTPTEDSRIIQASSQSQAQSQLQPPSPSLSEVHLSYPDAGENEGGALGSHKSNSTSTPTSILNSSSAANHSQDSVAEMGASNAPHGVNIGLTSTMSHVAQATNLRHLAVAADVDWNTHSSSTVKKESHQDSNPSGNSRTGGVTVLPKFSPVPPAPCILSRTQPRSPASSAAPPSATPPPKKHVISPPKWNQPAQGRMEAGVAVVEAQIKPDPDAPSVATPSLGDNSSAGGPRVYSTNSQIPTEDAGRTPVSTGGYSNSFSGRDAVTTVSRSNDKEPVGGANALIVTSSNGRRANRNAVYDEEYDVRKRTEVRGWTGEDRRNNGGGFPALAPLRSQAIQNRGYPNLDSDYGSTSHPALPPRRGDHWSPPATTPPRFPSPPTAPSLSNRKRAREDNSWSPDLQSHPPYRPRYDDSERDHMGRVGSRNDSRGYRPVRTPSTHWTEINSSAYVNSDTGTSLIPEDQFSNRTAFYYQDAAQSTSGISAAQAQPGYSQRNQPLTTYWPTEAHKVHDKTDLLSRLSDLPRPPPIGPAKTTNHKRAPGRDYPQYRGAPPKSRGRGNNSLMSRLNLRS